MYSLLILPRAQKELARLPEQEFERVRDAIRSLAETPRPPALPVSSPWFPLPIIVQVHRAPPDLAGGDEMDFSMWPDLPARFAFRAWKTRRMLS